jgi:hypothetical protein
MPVFVAPHPVSWRGREIAPGERVDAREEDAAELAAHGFRTADDTPRPVESLTRKELIALVRARTGINPITFSTARLRETASALIDQE